jgi:hypothetical protein
VTLSHRFKKEIQMSEAALIEDPNMPPHDFELEAGAEILTESAPVEQAEAPAEEAPEDVMTERAQKRFNKITAEKYAEKQRADELQRKLDERQAEPQKASAAPKLEDFDYDDNLHRSALIKYEVAEGMRAQAEESQKATRSASVQAEQDSFNDLVVGLGKSDFDEVAARVPTLDTALVKELMSSKEGVAMIYHLGTNLDVANQISQMSAFQGMAEMTRISDKLAAKPIIKLSAAPEPISPITSGSSLKKDFSEMSMEEIYGL